MLLSQLEIKAEKNQLAKGRMTGSARFKGVEVVATSLSYRYYVNGKQVSHHEARDRLSSL